MKKINTIKKADEFTAIISNRKFAATKGLVLYTKAKQQDKSRIGITVKKKTGNAVVRNKVKRQIRMMIDDIFDFNEPFDSIILIKEEYLLNSYENNKKNLEKLYKQVKMKW